METFNPDRSLYSTSQQVKDDENQSYVSSFMNESSQQAESQLEVQQWSRSVQGDLRFDTSRLKQQELAESSANPKEAEPIKKLGYSEIFQTVEKLNQEIILFSANLKSQQNDVQLTRWQLRATADDILSEISNAKQDTNEARKSLQGPLRIYIELVRINYEEGDTWVKLHYNNKVYHLSVSQEIEIEIKEPEQGTEIEGIVLQSLGQDKKLGEFSIEIIKLLNTINTRQFQLSFSFDQNDENAVEFKFSIKGLGQMKWMDAYKNPFQWMHRKIELDSKNSDPRNSIRFYYEEIMAKNYPSGTSKRQESKQQESQLQKEILPNNKHSAEIQQMLDELQLYDTHYWEPISHSDLQLADPNKFEISYKARTIDLRPSQTSDQENPDPRDPDHPQENMQQKSMQSSIQMEKSSLNSQIQPNIRQSSQTEYLTMSESQAQSGVTGIMEHIKESANEVISEKAEDQSLEESVSHQEIKPQSKLILSNKNERQPKRPLYKN